MHTLIITAHPSSKGFTHQIALAFQRGRLATAGNTVEILDLYKTDLKQDFLTFEDIKAMAPDPVRQIMQQKILDANEIVFIHPLWWMGPPAILKNWLDNNLAARFSYRYIDGKPVGLLKGRTARVFITCDGPKYIYWLIAMPFAINWILGILRFNGLRVASFRLLDRKRFRSQEYLDAYTKKVENMART